MKTVNSTVEMLQQSCFARSKHNVCNTVRGKNFPDKKSPEIRYCALRKTFSNVNENRFYSTKPCYSGERNKYLFALARKCSSIASDNLVRWITFFFGATSFSRNVISSNRRSAEIQLCRIIILPKKKLPKVI